MIALPTVTFYASLDGVNYYEMNAGAAVAPKDDLAETATATLTADFSIRIAANARYIKAVATFQNGWIFLSELSVDTTDVEGEDLGAGYAYTDSYMEGYCIGVYHPEDGELDLTQNGDGKMLKSAQLIKAKYNADKGAYEVIYSKVNLWPAGHEGTEILAEGEILVAISTQGNIGKDDFSGAKWIARGLKEGDLIVLNEGTIAFYPTDSVLPEIPETPDEPEVPESENLVAGKDYVISEQFRMGGADVGWGWDENAAPSYPDIDFELTDGVLPPADYSDAGWMAFHNNTPAQKERGYAYVRFDLGEVKDLGYF